MSYSPRIESNREGAPSSRERLVQAARGVEFRIIEEDIRMRVQLDIIEKLIKNVPPTTLKPREFFIAYQGVPTLAYNGFSRKLLELKQKIEKEVPGIKQENQGSMWPKTTLGALNDDKKLSWEQAFALREICTEMNGKVLEDKWCLKVEELSVVVFQCRSLEKRLVTHKIELAGSRKDPSGDAPPKSHLALVDQIMAQFSEDRLSSYLADLQKEGNRLSDYTRDHIEATLVCDLPNKQPTFIKSFIDRVNQELPGMYSWFAPRSRHMTVRALLTEQPPRQG